MKLSVSENLKLIFKGSKDKMKKENSSEFLRRNFVFGPVGGALKVSGSFRTRVARKPRDGLVQVRGWCYRARLTITMLALSASTLTRLLGHDWSLLPGKASGSFRARAARKPRDGLVQVRGWCYRAKLTITVLALSASTLTLLLGHD